jgi:hypothetical protein
MNSQLVVKIINNQYGFSPQLIKVCNYVENVGQLENPIIAHFVETLYNYYSSCEDRHTPRATVKNDTITIIHELWCDDLLILKAVPTGYRLLPNSSVPYRPDNLIISQNQVLEIIKQMMNDDSL